MQKITAPFQTYNGGKSGAGVYQQIINLIPPIKRYYELCVGNGGVFRRLQLPVFTVINDIDKAVCDSWKKTLCKEISVAATIGKKGDNGVFITNSDAAKFLQWMPYSHNNPGTFVYIDPPYLFSTRKTDRPRYQFEQTDEWHSTLLNECITANCSVMISHYECDMYNDILKGWNKHSFNARTRKSTVVETVYYNYPKPTLLQDYRYIGDDYREREEIKRKVKRYLAKLERLPEKQRIAILSAVIGKNNGTAAEILQQHK
jgi:DNA adenine methylase